MIYAEIGDGSTDRIRRNWGGKKSVSPNWGDFDISLSRCLGARIVQKKRAPSLN